MSEKAKTNLPKQQTPFSFEGEVSEIKITIPLTELITVDRYRSQIFKVFDIGSKANTLNLTENKPELLSGPKIEGQYQEGSVSPSYVSLNIRDKILHNAMLDSGASHNLMPKEVMENLRLEVTQPYKNLYSFDSSQVKCLGLIKNLEECSKDTISHFEITDSEMEEESKPLGSIPLCFKSFQTLKENLHPKDLSAIIQENPAQVNSHLNQAELIEEEFKSKIEDKEKPVGSLPLC